MCLTVFLMITLAYYYIIMHNNTAHHWVWSYAAQALFRQLQATLHILIKVIHLNKNKPYIYRIKLHITNQIVEKQKISIKSSIFSISGIFNLYLFLFNGLIFRNYLYLSCTLNEK